MQIPQRVQRFIEATNSFCIIMENEEPQFVVAPFEWAERVFIGFADDSETFDEEDGQEATFEDDGMDTANSTISAVAESERTGELPTIEE